MKILKGLIKHLIKYIMLVEFVFTPLLICFKDSLDNTPNILVKVCLMFYMIAMIFIFHWVVGDK